MSRHHCEWILAFRHRAAVDHAARFPSHCARTRGSRSLYRGTPAPPTPSAPTYRRRHPPVTEHMRCTRDVFLSLK